MFDIITDSACDLTLDTAKQLGIEVVPFYVSLDGEHYRKEGLEIPVRPIPRPVWRPSRTLKRPSAHTPRRVGRYCVWCSPAR